MGKWKEVKLGIATQISKGQQLNKIDLEKAGEYPCINGGMEPSGYTDKWNTVENTITISEGGNSCGFVQLLTVPFWSGGHCYTLLNLDENLEVNFLYHALKGREHLLMGLRVGSGLPNIQKSALSNFELEYPCDNSEQARIAEILSKADVAISQTEALIAKYQRVKTGLMQDLLTKGIDADGNIRSKETHEFVVKNGMEVPAEWDVVELKHCSNSLDNLRRPIKEEYRQHRKGIYPYYGASGIIDFIDDFIFDEELILLGEDGENILSRKLPLAFVANGKYWVNNHAHVIKPNSDMDLFFLCMQLESFDYAPLNTSSTQPKITKGNIEKIKIAKPSFDEQKRIALKAKQIETTISQYKIVSQKLHSLKTGLMQDLLSGKVRVPLKEPQATLSTNFFYSYYIPMSVAIRNEIKTDKISIKNIFEQWYRIPEYQRPYVWGKDEVTDLLDDISYAAVNTPSNEYFMGSFVYQHKKPSENQEYVENDLLDGQQRITTLFLLFAVIRDIETNTKRKQSCQKYIYQEEDNDTGTPARIRLLYKIRPEVEKFIHEYIKPQNSITDKWEDLKRLAGEDKDVSIKNMANAIISIRTYFEEHKNIDTFFPYLLQYAMMIYVYSEQLEDAFRLFTILNDRGVKLRNSDILKAQNLQHVPDTDRVKYGQKWEELEGELGEDFDRFLSFIRTIVVKEKARLSLLQEFEDKIYKDKDKGHDGSKTPLLNRGKETFDMLEKYFKHYDQLFENDNHSFTNGFEFNNLLVVMKTTLPSTDWIPPLLSYYNKFHSTRIYDFLLLLDKKFTGDWVGQLTPTERIENMNTILKRIETEATPEALFSTGVFEFDQDSFLKNLEGKVYGRQFAKNILLKLDFLLNDNKTIKWSAFSQITVEHILPQTPKDGSQWKKDFTDAERGELTNKIGNLILLGRGKNASQGRLDYEQKHEKYFAKNINTFPNSLKVFNTYQKKWTKTELAKNQTDVLDTLKTYYNI